MTDGVRPIGGSQGTSIQERREGDRRGRDRRHQARREGAASDSRDLVPSGSSADHASAKPAAPMPVPPAAFSAQMIGQGGQKRGIKGGAPVLDAARSTYLGTEYSGKNDRRPTPGQDTETEI
jgi:hypothetical protein